MKKKIINGNVIEYFDSIESLTIDRFSEYNRYLMLDSGIGSGAEDVGRKIGSVQAYLNHKDIENASKELQNLFHSIVFTINNINPKSYAFAVLVSKINGKEVGQDISKEGLDLIIKELSYKGLNFRKMSAWIDEVKKNWSQKLKHFFQRSAG